MGFPPVQADSLKSPPTFGLGSGGGVVPAVDAEVVLGVVIVITDLLD